LSPRRALALSVLLLFAVRAGAHPGLHHDIARVTEAIERAPNQADLYVERAYFERLDGRLEEALMDLDTAQRLDPSNPRVAAERGMALSARRDDVEAERELSRFAEAGGTAPIFMERAAVRVRLGRKSEALADYAAAIRLRPDVEAFMARGELQESMGDLDAAAAGYRDGLAATGGAVSIRLALVRVESVRNHPDAALALLDEELARARVKTDWYLRRAEVEEKAGRTSAARADREKALAEANRVIGTTPTGIHYLSRARALFALGHTDEARRDLDVALTKSPRFIEARQLLELLDAVDGGKGSKP